MDAKYEFSRLRQSMEMVGFSPDKQSKLFALLSAVLLIGEGTATGQEGEGRWGKKIREWEGLGQEGKGKKGRSGKKRAMTGRQGMKTVRGRNVIKGEKDRAIQDEMRCIFSRRAHRKDVADGNL